MTLPKLGKPADCLNTLQTSQENSSVKSRNRTEQKGTAQHASTPKENLPPRSEHSKITTGEQQNKNIRISSEDNDIMTQLLDSSCLCSVSCILQERSSVDQTTQILISCRYTKVATKGVHIWHMAQKPGENHLGRNYAGGHRASIPGG